MTRRLVVVGGGIAGAAAAWSAAEAARARGESLEVVLLERARRLGGKACTHHDPAGFTLEGGPSSFLDHPDLAPLYQAAGQQPLEADPAANKRFLLRSEGLVEVPTHPLRFARSGVLGLGGLLRALAEPLVRAGEHDEETLAAFITRRFGSQVTQRLARPMTLGVYAARPEELSVDAAFPRLRELEREHGSLLRGLAAARKAGAQRSLGTFAGGMQGFVEDLTRAAGAQVRSGLSAEAIEPGAGAAWQVHHEEGSLDADAVVVAADAHSAARLLSRSAPDAAAALSELQVAAVAVVAMGFDEQAQACLPQGFGALTAPGADLRMLGTLWEGRIFPTKGAAVRVLYGGTPDPDAVSMEPEALTDLARRELRQATGLDAEPLATRVFRWKRAIPLAARGHRERVERAVASARAAGDGRGGLALCGAWRGGVSFADAARSGMAAGAQALAATRGA